ncbi:hypothetical protein ACQ4PT_034813 [Festuca glaucescens]
MASRPLLPQFLIPFLALLCLAPSCAARRVSVSVYYEALCPFCSGYVVNDLARIFQNGLSSIVDLRLVPFGNGRVSPDGSMTCQHGEDECRLNAIEACVIRLWPDALELQNAAETFALQPPNQFVPWVVVNGRPLGDRNPRELAIVLALCIALWF